MDKSSISEPLTEMLQPVWLDLRDSERGHIVVLTTDDAVLRREAMSELHLGLQDRYELFEFDYAETEQLSLPRFCRGLQTERPACVFAFGLARLKEKDRDRYDDALHLLNAHREDIKYTNSTVVLWLSSETQGDLLWQAPDFADWSTVNVALTFSPEANLRRQARRYEEMLARPDLAPALVSSFRRQLAEANERLEQINQSYDVFLSAALEDIAWASELAERLRREGVRVWIDEQELWTSHHLQSWLTGGAPKCRKLVAVWSPHYFNDDRVKPLIEHFIQEYPDRLINERPLVPILLEDYTPPSNWRELRPIEFTHREDFELRLYQLIQALDLPAGEKKEPVKEEPSSVHQIGSEQTEGRRFVEEVAELYRIFGFTPERGTQISDVSVDLSIQKKEGGFLTRAVVECWDHHPTAAELEEILHRRAQALTTQSLIRWIVVSAQPLDRETQQTLAKAGIDYVLYAELLRELAPLDSYTARLIDGYEKQREERWRGEDWFVRPDIVTDDPEKRQALKHIARWLNDDRANLLMILGDAGTGKSTLAGFVAYQLARAFQSDPVRHPAPVLIPLGEVRREVALEGVIIDHFSRRELQLNEYQRFEHLARQGKIVLLFDAFDEMADHVKREVMQNNIRELLRLAWQGGKVLITCRTNYFKDYQEQVRLFGQPPSLSADEKAIYRQLDPQPGKKVIHLREFNDEQVQTYLAKARPDTATEDWRKIEAIYNLKELAQRPLLLDMIVTSLPSLEQGQKINAASLYKVYTNSWIDREIYKERALLSRENKLTLMMELAWKFWKDHQEAIDFAGLETWVRSLHRLHPELAIDELETRDVIREMQTASFLKREQSGKGELFYFAHHSFKEYFLAQKLSRALVSSTRHGIVERCLRASLFDRNIIYFLTLLGEFDHGKLLLRRILNESYLPMVSENALQILYWSSRITLDSGEKTTDYIKLREVLADALPPAVKLAGAELAGINLEAANLSEAVFSEAELMNATFDGAQLANADFRGANLENASFVGADLTGCDFTNAKNLRQANFSEAKLDGVKGHS